MAKTRGNPFTGDGALGRSAWKSPTTNSAVRVTAHERKRPVKRIAAPADKVADNTFKSDSFAGGGATVQGLDGEPRVNHLKAAVGLLNRKGSVRV